jgi:hypothetical protein
MIKKLIIFSLTFLFILPAFYSISANPDEPTQPDQPLEGPGSSDYSHSMVIKTRYKRGGEQFWIFEPIMPKPKSAPLIVFNHGWSAIRPISYRAWINHIVKKGNIVVYPRYQKRLVRGFDNFSKNAINAVKDAIEILNKGWHVRPELDKFAILGHSLGGGITVNMAAIADEVGLPIPKAIMPVQPYIHRVEKANFSKISNKTLMLIIVGEEDATAGNFSAKIIFKETPQIPLSNKDYIIQVTDNYGSPDIKADHMAPVCLPRFLSNSVDAMDYYSTWKLFDALTDYAFYNQNFEYCFGNTPEQRFMGIWSDGTPVKELIVTDYP